MSENMKYCLYYNKNVVLSSHNSMGQCQCLNCKEEKCLMFGCKKWMGLWILRAQFMPIPCSFCLDKKQR